MKIPLRYFIAACLLLGAIGVPWAWRTYQARREAEIERLEKELRELWDHYPDAWYLLGNDHNLKQISIDVDACYDVQAKQIAHRLEKLTGKRPVDPRYYSPSIGP